MQVRIQRSESEMTLLVAKASVFQEKADISNRVRIDKIMTSYKRKTIEHNDQLIRQKNRDFLKFNSVHSSQSKLND